MNICWWGGVKVIHRWHFNDIWLHPINKYSLKFQFLPGFFFISVQYTSTWSVNLECPLAECLPHLGWDEPLPQAGPGVRQTQVLLRVLRKWRDSVTRFFCLHLYFHTWNPHGLLASGGELFAKVSISRSINCIIIYKCQVGHFIWPSSVSSTCYPAVYSFFLSLFGNLLSFAYSTYCTVYIQKGGSFLLSRPPHRCTICKSCYNIVVLSDTFDIFLSCFRPRNFLKFDWVTY